jgi:hypothetical protein
MNYSSISRCNSAITGGMPESGFASRGQRTILPDAGLSALIGRNGA